METADEPQLSSSPSSSSQKEEKSDEKEGESDENPSHVDDEEATDDVEGEKQVKRNYHLDTSHGFLREVRRIQENVNFFFSSFPHFLSLNRSLFLDD